MRESANQQARSHPPLLQLRYLCGKNGPPLRLDQPLHRLPQLQVFSAVHQPAFLWCPGLRLSSDKFHAAGKHRDSFSNNTAGVHRNCLSATYYLTGPRTVYCTCHDGFYQISSTLEYMKGKPFRYCWKEEDEVVSVI